MTEADLTIIKMKQSLGLESNAKPSFSRKNKSLLLFLGPNQAGKGAKVIKKAEALFAQL